MQKKNILIIFVAFFIFIFLMIFIGNTQKNKTSSLELQYSPTSSIVKIDSHKAKGGIVKVTPGKHTINISKEGFAPSTQAVDVKKGESKYIGVVLKPNSQSTTRWYFENPNDQKVAESISSNSFDEASLSEVSNMPLLQYLPAITREFSINYGQSTNNTYIYIDAPTPAFRILALNWIREKGYDPTDYSIVFKNTINPLTESSENE